MQNGWRRRVSGLAIGLSALLLMAGCGSSGGGGNNNNNNNNGNNPTPAITTLSPASLTVGSSGQTLTINGTGFVSSSTVTFNGAGAAATFVSSTQLTIPLTTGQLAATGSFPVVVTSPTPGGGASNTVNFMVVNPTPAISSLSPPSATAGATGFTLTINGSGFLSTSTATVSNAATTVTYVSSAELMIQLTTAQLVSVATLGIQVTNPAPGGGASNTSNFSVTASGNPVPVVSGFTPNSLVAGTTGPQTVQINGTGFLSTSTVTFNGTAIAATYVSATELTIALTTGDLQTSGNYPVVVTNPTPGGGHSISVNFDVTAALSSCPYTGNSNSLNGQYAFILTGYNSSSYSGFLGVVGSFTANGTGGITAGELDSNGALGVQNTSIETAGSSYSVGPTGDGCLTLKTSFYTFTTRIALITTAEAASQGTVMEWEPGPNPYIASGQFFKQNLPATPSGTYVTVQSGTYSQEARLALVSALTFSGGSVSGEFDSNADGTVDSGGAGPVSLTGSYGTTLDANGRTTSTTTSTISTKHGAAYFVSANQFVLITTDTPGTDITILTGMGFAQIETPSLSSGGKVAFFGSGLNGGGGGSAELGLVNVTSTTSLTANTYEYVDGTYATSTNTCTYSVDTLGRLGLTGGSCGTHPPILYLTGPDAGVAMGTDAGAGIGQAFQQISTSVTGGGYMVGTYTVPNVNITETEVGEGILTSAPVITGTADFTSLTSLQQSDQSLAGGGTTSVSGTGTLSNSNHPGDVSGLVVSPSQLIVVDGGGSEYPAILLINTIPSA